MTIVSPVATAADGAAAGGVAACSALSDSVPSFFSPEHAIREAIAATDTSMRILFLLIINSSFLLVMPQPRRDMDQKSFLLNL
jgi:hypothetical protein